MRSKVTVVLLFLNVALFAYIYYFEGPTGGDGPSTRAVLPAEITGMESFTRTNRAGEVVKLQKRGESWWLTQPYEWPASQSAVNSIHNELMLLRNITSFKVADLAKSGQSLADYGLAEPAMTLEFRTGTKTYRLLVGDNTKDENNLYVLSPDGDRVHVVSRSLAESVGLSVAELRNPASFTIPVFEVRSLNIQTGAPSNLKVRLRRDAASKWNFESPILARAAKTSVEVTINALNSLVPKSFLSPQDADLDRTGLNSPTLRVTLEGNARRETLLLGNPAPTAGDFYAKIEDKTVVFTVTVRPELLEILRSSQENLRDAHVMDFDPATVTALTIVTPGQPELALQKLESAKPAANDAPPAADAWQVVTRVAGQAPLTVAGDPTVITDLLRKLQQLSARRTTLADGQVRFGFLSDAPAAADLERYGFARPEREITLNLNTGGGISGKDASNTVLQVGVSPDEPGKAFARLTNPPFVYEILPDILDDTPAVARHYRLRQLRDLPEGARITSLALIDLGTNAPIYSQKLKEGDTNWDAALAAEPATVRPHLATILTQLRKLRARDFVSDTFSGDHADTPQGSRPWRFRLDYTIAFNGGDATPSSLLLTERLGGALQLAGTGDFGGLVFSLPQELIDALFPLTYGNKNDPGPAAPNGPPVTPAAAPVPPPATTPAPEPPKS